MIYIYIKKIIIIKNDKLYKSVSFFFWSRSPKQNFYFSGLTDNAVSVHSLLAQSVHSLTLSLATFLRWNFNPQAGSEAYRSPLSVYHYRRGDINDRSPRSATNWNKKSPRNGKIARRSSLHVEHCKSKGYLSRTNRPKCWYQWVP